MKLEELLRKAQPLFREEGRLIRLPGGKTVVFVGDTHGDREATERVLERYLSPEHVIVFLGDYVDRGPDSEGNLRLLLETKLAHTDRIFLLMGNHEGWAVSSFYPADFWHSMPPDKQRLFADTLCELTLAAWHPSGVLALHGALPDVESIEEIEEIQPGSSNWQNITWGDWADVPGYSVGDYFGRPTFGRSFFEETMNRLGLKVLVRSHQPFVPTFLFDDRCLTIFTSCAYGGTRRTVAVLRPDKPIHTAKDLEIETV